jgi:hypothetical protein
MVLAKKAAKEEQRVNDALQTTNYEGKRWNRE